MIDPVRCPLCKGERTVTQGRPCVGCSGTGLVERSPYHEPKPRIPEGPTLKGLLISIAIGAALGAGAALVGLAIGGLLPLS